MYKDELIKAMDYLGSKQDVHFIGQQLLYHGNPMSTTLSGVDKSLMTEVPVFEETQMGMSLGMAMSGYTVVTFYPRWDFLVCATNQLVNHVDKFELMTSKKANIIIRVGKGADKPLDPGHQHKGNYLTEFKAMCPNIHFHDLLETDAVFDTFKHAYDTGGVHVIIEYPGLYNNE